jgi:hypothetical protein
MLAAIGHVLMMSFTMAPGNSLGADSRVLALGNYPGGCFQGGDEPLAAG